MNRKKQIITMALVLFLLAGGIFAGYCVGYDVGEKDAFEKARYATAHIERYYLRRL